MAAQIRLWKVLREVLSLQRRKRLRQKPQFMCGYIAILSARAEGKELFICDSQPADRSPGVPEAYEYEYLEPPEWVSTLSEAKK